MKKAHIALLCLVSAAVLNACGKTDQRMASGYVTEKESDTAFSLTDAERNYLLSAGADEEDLTSLTEQTLATLMLGTGLERSHQTTGIAELGVTYETELEELPQTSISEEKITFQNIKDLADKQDTLRLTDFTPFQYTLNEKEGNVIASFQLTETDTGHLEVWYQRKNRTVTISHLYVVFQDNHEVQMVYNVYTDLGTIQAVLSDEPYGTLDKLAISLIYGSKNTEGCYIRIRNGTEEDYTVKQSCRLVEKGTENKESNLLANLILPDGAEYNLPSSNFCTYYVEFSGVSKFEVENYTLYITLTDADGAEKELELDL